MKQKNLWILCGIPGSGKSTWCAKAVKKPGAVKVSRDAIRFALLDDNDYYFIHEKEVFREFVRLINENLANDEVTDVFADATHLNEMSRNKLLQHINLKGVSLNAVNFIIDLDLAQERNNQREGHAVVPEAVIHNMSYRYNPARKGERFNYDKVIDIKVTKEGETAYDIYDF